MKTCVNRAAPILSSQLALVLLEISQYRVSHFFWGVISSPPVLQTDRFQIEISNGAVEEKFHNALHTEGV